jgi:hypothetical protein
METSQRALQIVNEEKILLSSLFWEIRKSTGVSEKYEYAASIPAVKE